MANEHQQPGDPARVDIALGRHALARDQVDLLRLWCVIRVAEVEWYDNPQQHIIPVKEGLEPVWMRTGEDVAGLKALLGKGHQGAPAWWRLDKREVRIKGEMKARVCARRRSAKRIVKALRVSVQIPLAVLFGPVEAFKAEVERRCATADVGEILWWAEHDYTDAGWDLADPTLARVRALIREARG